MPYLKCIIGIILKKEMKKLAILEYQLCLEFWVRVLTYPLNVHLLSLFYVLHGECVPASTSDWWTLSHVSTFWQQRRLAKVVVAFYKATVINNLVLAKDSHKMDRKERVQK